MKAIHYLFLLIYIAFAAVQYNDPDPYIWITVYLIFAVLTAWFLFGKANKNIHLAAIVVSLITVLYMSGSVYTWLFHHSEDSLIHSMAPDKPYIEESRECLGLLIASFGIIIQYIQLRKSK